MKRFAAKRPILFELFLFIAAMAAALFFSLIGQLLNYPNEPSVAAGRILAGILLFLLFRYCFRQDRPFAGLRWMLPALLFVLWNLLYHLLAGVQMLPAGQLGLPILLALAPAVFEEILFRGIFLHHLAENGKSPMAALWISAIFFGLVHLTNIAGMDPADVLVQAAYALVVGLVFGAVYLKSRDILSVILAHALIDFSNQLFVSSPGESSVPMLIVFVLLLLAEAFYALRITPKKEAAADAD